MNKVIQGDSLEVMKSIEDSSIDLILTDPPYHKVKKEAWDRKFDKPDQFLEWIDKLCAEWQRILKPNGSLYCFASPKMSARVEVTIGRRFNVLNNIRWDKKDHPGRHKGSYKEGLRRYFGASESIIFAEHFGADNTAKGEAGYGAKCDELRGFVFEPLRAYLDGERKRAQLRKDDINICLGFRPSGGMASRKYFSQSQYQLPTESHYLKIQQAFPGYFLRPYEELRQQYEELRQQYEELRRPFNVTASVPYTDTWTYPTVQAYKGKHVCEKPSKMLEDMINASSKPGSIVLDCFAGSGSTLIAAKKLGRQFIGIELDPHWVNVANQKLDLRPQPTIEERLTWLETKVKVIDKRSKKTAAAIGQLNLFGEAG